MTKKLALLFALIFVFSLGQFASAQNTNSSTTNRGRNAERREERGEERGEGRKHRRHKHRRHNQGAGDTNRNTNR
ncbi:MAG: hypothetical protein M3R67_00875 [Acidobacteriota bacterium]|nr:hypothetical protein [Acidobacteriota bacterium]